MILRSGLTKQVCPVCDTSTAASTYVALDTHYSPLSSPLYVSPLYVQYLEQVKSFGEVEGLSVTISVGRYNADIARYPGMVLRGFVYEVN